MQATNASNPCHALHLKPN